jgi:ABC-2 type transport system ATP-binding protein
MDNFLEISNVCKRFVNHVALDNVSINVPRGKVFGLLGPNGAGKTTLIRIINHITMADSGSVVFDGHLLRGDDVYNIGYLPEERGLYKKMKVGEQAVYLSRLKGLSSMEAKKRLKEWFEKFDILDWWDRKVEELSKGMQQKVQFIITVLHEPQLLILDEPFSGFDPNNADLLKIRMQNAWNGVEESYRQLQLAKHSIEQAEENLRLNRDYYRAGTSRMSDLLEAQLL